VRDLADVRRALKRLADLLGRYDAPAPQRDIDLATSDRVRAASRDTDDHLWEFLTSDTLWGGAGSIADQAGCAGTRTRAEVESMLVAIGRFQLDRGRANVRTEAWVTAFTRWSKP